MSQYLTGLAAGQRFRENQEERRDKQASTLVNSLTPYTQNYQFGEDGEAKVDFRTVTPDKFLELTGIQKTDSGELDYSNLESIDDKFYKVNNNDLITDTINSLSTARSYTDINTQKTKEGKVVAVRVNKKNGAIHYDLKTDQGIVPKTLGFSNDPKDIVMSSDLDGFRTLFNTAVRQTFRNSGQGALAGQSFVAGENYKKYGNQPLSGSGSPTGNALDTIAYFDNQVALGNIKPIEAFKNIANIGTEIDNVIDSFNQTQDDKTKASSEEFDRSGQTLTQEEAREIVNSGEFYNQSGDIQRQILSLVPGNYLGYKIGLNKDLQEQLKNSSGEQKIERDETTVTRPGTVPRARGTKERSVDYRLTDPQPETIEQGGVEYQRVTPQPEVFEGTNLTFPTEGTVSEQQEFIETNREELLRVGLDPNFLEKAQKTFNELGINSPEDMTKLKDPNIPFGRINAALAYAVAAGGADSPANFLRNFQGGLNMINTGDVNVSAADRADKLIDIAQSNQKILDDRAALIAELRQEGRNAELDVIEGIIEDAKKLNYFEDYKGDVSKYLKTAPLVKRNFRGLLNTIRETGGQGKSPIRFNENGLVDPNSITPGARRILSQEIGRYIGAFAVSEGTAQKGGLFGSGFFSDRQNLPNIVGNLASRVEIRTELVNNREQISEIVVKDPTGTQYVPIMTGNQFREQFPDAEFSGMALSVLPRAEE